MKALNCVGFKIIEKYINAQIEPKRNNRGKSMGKPLAARNKSKSIVAERRINRPTQDIEALPVILKAIMKNKGAMSICACSVDLYPDKAAVTFSILF